MSVLSGGAESEEETIKLPQSTHSLLFTARILSVPFAFALLVLIISILALGLALSDNLSNGGPGNRLGVPANVPWEVRTAHYISILIAITMEEEIPEGTYLLRMIPKSSVERLGISYGRFVISAMCRLAIGYMFLFNVFLVLVQSERVLDMLYDLLALSFVSMMDDIAFQLAKKYDIMGKQLRLAASAKFFRAEFQRKPYAFRKKMTIFVKLLYVTNLLLFVGGMIVISGMQNSGRFQCGSITATFGEEVWEKAWVHMPNGQTTTGVLFYSFFNGVYKHNGTFHDGRPVYWEQRKSDDGDFKTKVPAKIKYCISEGAWVFTHDNIKKSEASRESSCPWLLRSPNTRAYDLMDVSKEWEIWVGKISRGANMDFTCNGCQENTDCNLNGVCTNEMKCDCSNSS